MDWPGCQSSAYFFWPPLGPEPPLNRPRLWFSPSRNHHNEPRPNLRAAICGIPSGRYRRTLSSPPHRCPKGPGKAAQNLIIAHAGAKVFPVSVSHLKTAGECRKPTHPKFFFWGPNKFPIPPPAPPANPTPQTPRAAGARQRKK